MGLVLFCFSGCSPHFCELQPKHLASLKSGLVPSCLLEWLPFRVKSLILTKFLLVFSAGEPGAAVTVLRRAATGRIPEQQERKE